ncbi:UPF0481 protein At3g47200-like [Ipomoea triloba]|uniref:UPF0481 protein At3g47200-like n=1 Tax=Ipomoea triloba TaxID=35885 RepID=UPI00125E0707|nr:UPF0481 protein At3g47200-like [Ipomoea triloba]
MESLIGMNPCKESHKKEEKIKEEMYKKNEMNTTNSVEFGSYHILDPPESSASGQVPIDRNPSKEHKKEEKKEKEEEKIEKEKDDDKYYSFKYCTNIYITQQNTANPIKFGSYHHPPPPPRMSFAAGQIPIDRTPSKEHEKKEKIDKTKEDYYDRKDMNTPAKKEEKKDKEKKDGEKKDTVLLHIPGFCEEECIFRVHDGLRTTPADYEPMLISIGPYFHRKMKRHSRKMKNLKERYLQSFLKRAEGRGLTKENISNKLKGLESRAKSYYGDPIIDMEGYEFVEMLLHDGCFVVEFVVRSKSTTTGCSSDPPPIHVPDWMRVQIVRDMLLMENQLPFFVLNELYELIMDTTQDRTPFLNLVEFTFSDVLSKLRYFSLILNEVNDQEIKHLLQLVHILCRPHQSQVTEIRTPHPATSMESSYIRCASELLEAGVDFKKVAGHNMMSLFNIRFNRGTLEIPSFRLGDSSVSLFKNLIAYEQHSVDVYPKYFSDYVVFMDDLIKTDKDVSVLRLNGIILNGLGNDKEVAHLFNTLSKGVVYSSRDYCYANVCYDLIQHCNKPRNVLMSKLRRDYFHSPWAGISTVAAVLLLFLTATQTITSILGLHK